MKAIDAALQAALLVMRSGGSSVMADRAFTNILKGYRKDSVATVWRLDIITAIDPAQSPASQLLRPVGAVGLHLLRASEVAVLAERAASGELDMSTVASEIDRIGQLVSPYRPWMAILAAAGAAGSFTQTIGGDWGSLGIAAIAGGTGQTVRSVLQARRLARVPITIICGLISGLIGTVGLRLGLSHAAPATLIGSVIYMVPGLMLVNGLIEMSASRHLFVGVQRLIDASFIFLLLAVILAIADAAM
jgi:uncharacterized membrane protein YjjP (DUF1212 family)